MAALGGKENSLLNWLKRKKEPYDEEEILNDGLDLAMAFGKHWLQPIQTRLSKIYPALSEEELNEYNAKVQEAMKFGHSTVYSLAEKDGKDTKPEEFNDIYIQKYPWVNSKNIKHLFSQGMYYAWKDFGF